MNDTRLKTIYSIALVSSMSLIMAVGCTGNDSMKYKVDTSLAEESTSEVVEMQDTEVSIEEDVAENSQIENAIMQEIEDLIGVKETATTPEEAELVSDAVTPEPERVLIKFAFDESTVSSEHGDTLWQYAQYLKENSNLVLEVSGHTDESGERVYNEYLSQKRAQAVAKILVEFGAPEDRVKTIGYANDLPLQGAISHREHRRVELDFQDQHIVSN